MLCPVPLARLHLDVYSVHELLHSLIVGDVSNVLDVNSASMFRVELCRLSGMCICITLYFRNEVWRKRRRNGRHKCPLYTPPIHLKTECYVYTANQPTHLDPADGVSMYLRNVGNITHVHTYDDPRTRLTSIINHRERLKLGNVYEYILSVIKRVYLLWLWSALSCFSCPVWGG